MSELHVTWVDVIVVVIVGFSTLSAILRGFVRETLSLFAWVAAASVTIYFGHYAVPLFAPHFSPVVAQIVAYSAVLLLVLIPLSLIAYRISEKVRTSPVGTLDRSLGGAFGIVRGLVIVAVAYVAFSSVVPVRAQPESLSHARLLPLVQGSVDALLSFVPVQGANLQARSGKAAVAAKSARKSYGAEARHALDSLIEATGDGGGGKQP